MAPRTCLSEHNKIKNGKSESQLNGQTFFLAPRNSGKAKNLQPTCVNVLNLKTVISLSWGYTAAADTAWEWGMGGKEAFFNPLKTKHVYFQR